MRWPKLKDIFTFRPPEPDKTDKVIESVDHDSPYSRVEDLIPGQKISDREKETIRFSSEKIRFDNTFRFWIATSSVLVLLGLWVGGVLASIWPIAVIYGGYLAVQYGAAWMLLNTHHAREIDFGVCTVDMLGMSLAIFWTGGTASPLYFLYFVPLVIQAFHRDWALLNYYGFGGLSMYIFAILFSIDEWTATHLLDLGARIFFMLMTISISAMAVTLLRKKESYEQVNLSRMRLLTRVSYKLNRVNSLRDMTKIVEGVVADLNDELDNQLDAWARIFIIQNDSRYMRALSDPRNSRPEFAQELSTSSCPVMANGHMFRLNDLEQEAACPTENFSFKSHLCLPVTGNDSESFGVLFVGSERSDAFGEDVVRFLEFVARAVGLTMQRLIYMENVGMSIEMNSCATAAFVSSMRGTAAAYSAILEGLSSILKADRVSYFKWDAPTASVKFHQAVGQHAAEKLEHFHMGEGVPGKVLETGNAFFSNDLSTEIQNFSPNGYQSLLCVPLRSLKNEPLGVLCAWFLDNEPRVTSRHIDVAMTFATRAAIAVENGLEQERKGKGLTVEEDDQRKAA